MRPELNLLEGRLDVSVQDVTWLRHAPAAVAGVSVVLPGGSWVVLDVGDLAAVLEVGWDRDDASPAPPDGDAEALAALLGDPFDALLRQLRLLDDGVSREHPYVDAGATLGRVVDPDTANAPFLRAALASAVQRWSTLPVDEDALRSERDHLHRRAGLLPDDLAPVTALPGRAGPLVASHDVAALLDLVEHGGDLLETSSDRSLAAGRSGDVAAVPTRVATYADPARFGSRVLRDQRDRTTLVEATLTEGSDGVRVVAVTTRGYPGLTAASPDAAAMAAELVDRHSGDVLVAALLTPVETRQRGLVLQGAVEVPPDWAGDPADLVVEVVDFASHSVPRVGIERRFAEVQDLMLRAWRLSRLTAWPAGPEGLDVAPRVRALCAAALALLDQPVEPGPPDPEAPWLPSGDDVVRLSHLQAAAIAAFRDAGADQGVAALAPLRAEAALGPDPTGPFHVCVATLELRGGRVLVDVRDPTTLPAVVVTDAALARSWLDDDGGRPTVAGPVLATIVQLVVARWLLRWWPARRPRLPEVDVAVLELELGGLTWLLSPHLADPDPAVIGDLVGPHLTALAAWVTTVRTHAVGDRGEVAGEALLRSLRAAVVEVDPALPGYGACADLLATVDRDDADRRRLASRDDAWTRWPDQPRREPVTTRLRVAGAVPKAAQQEPFTVDWRQVPPRVLTGAEHNGRCSVKLRADSTLLRVEVDAVPRAPGGRHPDLRFRVRRGAEVFEGPLTKLRTADRYAGSLSVPGRLDDARTVEVFVPGWADDARVELDAPSPAEERQAIHAAISALLHDAETWHADRPDGGAVAVPPLVAVLVAAERLPRPTS